MMKTKENYDVGIYCRLSRDDNNGSSESMSISNQREMLKSYVKNPGLHSVAKMRLESRIYAKKVPISE